MSDEAGSWTVWRQDDNVNVFVVARHLSKEDADRLVAEYEAKKHKQMYWAERESTDGLP